MLNSRCCFAEDGTDLFIIACRTRCTRCTRCTLIFPRSTYQILSLCPCRCCCRLQRSSTLSSYHWPSSRVPQLHSKAAGIVLCIVALLQYLQSHICQSPEKHRARKVKSFQPSNLLTSSACPRILWAQADDAIKPLKCLQAVNGCGDTEKWSNNVSVNSTCAHPLPRANPEHLRYKLVRTGRHLKSPLCRAIDDR